MPRVFVAAGSNVDPERHLALAAEELQRTFGKVQFSPWYRNRAVGFEGDDFINFVIGFDSELSVHEVIGELRRIEALCGRPREAPKWAPRTMDLDILLYGDRVCSEPGLILPRPDLLRRPYMLGPLADLAPELAHPTAHATIGELWARFDRASHPLVRVPAKLTSRRSARRPPRESDR
ncbi:MAG TPA: 2-amino-4-hydroxy-6-hydroxymethyldihydropteridine diphosphokinase [Steroidobacteraceae bacterium]|nr:2-amino-4-hydroxy-6-hydroxymethyldihydropteridine diphosphokinase [Steroidobacteraceae bacterium]